MSFSLLRRFWPQFVALVLAGVLAGDLLMQLAAKVALANHFAGLAMLTLVALAQLVVTVAMFHVLRPGLPNVLAAQRGAGKAAAAGKQAGDTDRRGSRLVRMITIALLPFFAYYAAWGSSATSCGNIRAKRSTRPISARAPMCSTCSNSGRFERPQAMAVAAEEAGHEKLPPCPGEIGQAPFLAPARHVAPAGDEAGGLLDGFVRRQRRADRGQEQWLRLFQLVDDGLAAEMVETGLRDAVAADRIEGFQQDWTVAGITAGAGEIGGIHSCSRIMRVQFRADSHLQELYKHNSNRHKRETFGGV
ncbi:hypothetical protein LB569_18360 [Mesorhizobium sp. BH1-1-4]|nr:hypothetical protein [Mesorhizobium sp. BH1-1-4]